jgi:hypothetical protein
VNQDAVIWFLITGTALVVYALWEVAQARRQQIKRRELAARRRHVQRIEELLEHHAPTRRVS